MKAFGVGQAKAGTASIVGLLAANHRVAHEPERAATLDLILRHTHGELSDTAIREHLRERDARLDLEYDDRLVLRTGAEPITLIRCYALSDDC